MATAARDARQPLPPSACRSGLIAIGDAPARARSLANDASACAKVRRTCEWSIANALSSDQTHTTPGSFARLPPGACPNDQLDPLLRLTAVVRLAGPRGAGVCRLLTQAELRQARLDAAGERVTCGKAAIAQAVYGTMSAARRIAQPLSSVLLDSSAPGPPRWAAFITLLDRSSPQTALTLAMVKTATGAWKIEQIGYEF